MIYVFTIIPANNSATFFWYEVWCMSRSFNTSDCICKPRSAPLVQRKGVHSISYLVVWNLYTRLHVRILTIFDTLSINEIFKWIYFCMICLYRSLTIYLTYGVWFPSISGYLVVSLNTSFTWCYGYNMITYHNISGAA